MPILGYLYARRQGRCCDGGGGVGMLAVPIAVASDGGVGVGAAGGDSMMSTLTPCFSFDLQHH
jgi:hypothetical protein